MLTQSSQFGRKVFQSVVRIRNERTGTTGTGFTTKVGDQVCVITAAHVVQDAPLHKSKPVVSLQYLPTEDRPHAIEEYAVAVYVDKKNDIAVIWKEYLEDVSIPISVGVPNSVKSQVSTVGHPTPLPPWSALNCSVIKRAGLNFWVSGSIDEGCSGAPMINGERVVGMITNGNTAFSRCISSLALRQALQASKLTKDAWLPEDKETRMAELENTTNNPGPVTRGNLLLAVKLLYPSVNAEMHAVFSSFERNGHQGDYATLYQLAVLLDGARHAFKSDREAYAASQPFPDVPLNHWALAATRRLKAEGILVGDSDGLFRGGNYLDGESLYALFRGTME
ncbi:MAG: serine protease [Proteobacteria bacterium]|nr:MAG: serine protease [Pseudomonadota bacterium]